MWKGGDEALSFYFFIYQKPETEIKILVEASHGRKRRFSDIGDVVFVN